MESNYSIGNIPVSENSDMGFRTNVSSNKYNKKVNKEQTKKHPVRRCFDLYSVHCVEHTGISALLSCRVVLCKNTVSNCLVNVFNCDLVSISCNCLVSAFNRCKELLYIRIYTSCS